MVSQTNNDLKLKNTNTNQKIKLQSLSKKFLYSHKKEIKK